MLPVKHPGHNLFELAKQLVLLEAHLTLKQKQCDDCISKHFLALIAYTEEIPGLDSDGAISEAIEIEQLIPNCQVLFHHWANRIDPRLIAQSLRGIRKKIQPIAVEIAKANGINVVLPEEEADSDCQMHGEIQNCGQPGYCPGCGQQYMPCYSCGGPPASCGCSTSSCFTGC